MRTPRALLNALVPACVLFACAPTPAQDYDLDLDNGAIHVGVHRAEYGGAITYLSRSGEKRNLVNLHDRGREIQQSYYAGKALDRRDEGQSKNWSPWPWNPIQVGDTYGNSSKVVDSRRTDSELYVKTIPLLWDMKNEFGECYFETWITLDANTVHVRNRLTSHRTDDKWPAKPCHQELPAVYTIGDLSRLYTYVGDAPFTQGPLTLIVNDGPPWEHWGPGAQKPELNKPHEKWAANVDEHFWGVGVYNAKMERFVGGFHDKPGGDAHKNSTGYISPLRTETLDKNSVFEYEYDLIVGTLDEIRAFVYKREGHPYDSTRGSGVPEQ